MYARAYKYFFLITFEKKVPSRSDSLFQKIDSRKFKIYIYLCICHMVQINLFISLRSKYNSFRGK